MLEAVEDLNATQLPSTRLDDIMRRLPAIAAIATALAVSLTGCVSEGAGSSDANSDGIKVGFVYVSPVQGSGWSQAWDIARKDLESDLGADTTAVEPIPETADSVGVLENLVNEGNKVIFATAFGYQPFVAQVAEEHSDVTFVAIGPWVQDQAPPANVSVVSNDSWAVRYALGILAADTTKTGTLGFVAANPIPTVIASVNAFELGAKSVDPSITTNVVFTGTWYDPARSTQAAQTLASGGADVIAQYEDSTGTVLGAQTAGVWGIGSEIDSSQVLPDTYLSGSVNQWSDFTTDLVRSVQDGEYSQQQVVGSIASGMATLGTVNSKVSDSAKAAVEAAMSGMADGSVVPFTGPISSNDGQVKLQSGQSWADSVDVLKNQDFLVEGVVGTIPSS